MTLRSAASSLEFLRLPISATKAGAAFDPTGDDVDIAVVAAGTAPADDDYLPGEWEAGGPPYIARILIGPGSDLALEAGRYDCYWRVHDDPEIPAVFADSLVIYSTLTSFASVTELAERLGRDIDPEDQAVAAKLADATTLIRALTGQVVSAVEGDTQELMCNWGRTLWLPQRPVTDVTEVQIRLDYATAFTAIAISSLSWTRLGQLNYSSYHWGGPHSVARVTYDHGYDQIPPEIVAVTCSIAARAIASPSGQVLVSRSTTIGGAALAETYADTSSLEAARVGLTASEEAVLRRYGWQAEA